MAENPKIIIRSFKNGIDNTMSLLTVTGFLASRQLKNIKNRKEILQIKVNLEKKEINFIK
ncbi:MAG TPA: hypothetical protein VFI29_08925 [Hanamia sp.]|nr:hypothetical protein [Hanamia sp.]